MSILNIYKNNRSLLTVYLLLFLVRSIFAMPIENEDILIETHFIDATGYNSFESSVLENGIEYYLRVSGTYGYGGWSSPQCVDAAFAWCGQENYPHARVWTWNGSTGQLPTPDEYNQDHVYSYHFTSDGTTEEFGFEDNGGYGDNIGGLDIGIWRIAEEVNELDSVVTISLAEVDAFIYPEHVGDTIVVAVNIVLHDLDLFSSEIHFAGFQGYLDFIRIENTGTLSDTADWQILSNERENVLITAGYGSNAITQEGTLFNLVFAVNNNMAESVIPIEVVELELNEFDQEIMTSNGGISINHSPLGDVNMNGRVSAFDASFILKHLAGLQTLGSGYEVVGDVTNDNSLSALDAAIILDYVVGIVDELPIEGESMSTNGLFAISSNTVNPGQYFEVPISLSEGENIRSFELDIDYSNDELTLQSIIWDTEILSGLQHVENHGDGFLKVTAVVAESIPNGQHTIGKIIFQMNESFNDYETSVSISRSRANEGSVILDGSIGIYTNELLAINELSIELVPTIFALHQNYPNPFNPTTQISYDLPEASRVSISIHDLMGREIRTMINSEQTAGFKNLQWNATDNSGQPVSAGMYIYTIQAGEFRSTKKMLLLK
jgi:hypothetical protein